MQPLSHPPRTSSSLSLSGNSSGRRGFSLTELAIVLGVVGTIFAVVWVAASNVYLKQKTDDAMMELNTIVQNILSIYQGQDFSKLGYSNGSDLTANFIKGKVIPDWAVVGTTSPTVSNPWVPSGVTITLGTATLNSSVPYNRWFAMTYNNVPVQACVIMVTQAAACTYGTQGCPLRIIATGNGASASPLPIQAGPPQIWQLYSEDATTACSGGASGTSTTDTVEFDYGN